MMIPLSCGIVLREDLGISLCLDKCNDGGFEELDRPAPEVYPTETDLPEYGSGTIGDTPPATTAANVVVDVHRTMAATVFSQRDTTLSTTTSTKPGRLCHIAGLFFKG